MAKSNTAEKTREVATINISAEADDSYYNNILYNDPVTDALYVVMVIQRVFGLSTEEARRTMLYAHNNGSAIIGTYPRDEAYAYAEVVEQLNMQHGQLLQVTVEKA